MTHFVIWSPGFLNWKHCRIDVHHSNQSWGAILHFYLTRVGYVTTLTRKKANLLQFQLSIFFLRLFSVNSLFSLCSRKCCLFFSFQVFLNPSFFSLSPFGPSTLFCHLSIFCFLFPYLQVILQTYYLCYPPLFSWTPHNAFFSFCITSGFWAITSLIPAFFSAPLPTSLCTSHSLFFSFPYLAALYS